MPNLKPNQHQIGHPDFPLEIVDLSKDLLNKGYGFFCVDNFPVLDPFFMTPKGEAVLKQS